MLGGISRASCARTESQTTSECSKKSGLFRIIQGSFVGDVQGSFVGDDGSFMFGIGLFFANLSDKCMTQILEESTCAPVEC